MSGSGVVYITVGTSFTLDAVASARSVRAVSPALDIDLFCDDPDIVPDGVFDRKHRIASPHRRSKVDCLAKTRFERTLYLDSDTRVVADINEMFGILDRFDLAAAHAHARNRALTTQAWRTEIPPAFPQLNGGVILYRRTPDVLALLSDWSKSFGEAGFAKDQVTFRELVWLSDLRVFVLPPEYNVRYAKYLRVWDKVEAQPKILHMKKYNSTARPATGWRAWLLGRMGLS